MFKLSSTSLENLNLNQDLKSNSAGALCVFEGLVRDHDEGRCVTALEYEALTPLCEKEAERIFAEVKDKFNIIDLKCVHRTGRLSVGEMAVWVGVLAGHRDEAFQACRYVIDEVKKRLPIWKKEFYSDGESVWVNCQGFPSIPHS